LIPYRGLIVKGVVTGVGLPVDEAERGLLQADEVRARGEGWVAVAGMDSGDVEG